MSTEATERREESKTFDGSNGTRDYDARHLYGGVRIDLRATLAGARLTLQVDIGFGDAVTPAAQPIHYPAPQRPSSIARSQQPEDMPSVARRHHFLPQGYLAGFTDTGRKDGRLHVLDIRTGKGFRTSPLNVAVAKDFKRADVEGRPPDAVETALAPIEDQAVRAIRRVIEGEAFPSDEDYNLILNLLSLILAQNPKSRRALDGARSREADAKLEWLVSSQPIWERHVALARQAGEDLRGDLSHENARRFVEERRYRIAFDNLGTLQREFEAQDELLSALAKRTWSVLLAPDRGPHFITSDYPYSLAMEHGFRGTPQFLGRNTELFFPLGKTAGFIGVLGTPLKPVVRVDPTAVSIMNRRVVRRADRQLFMPDSSFVTFDSGNLVEVHLTLSS